MQGGEKMEWLNNPSLKVIEPVYNNKGEIEPMFCVVDWCFIYQECIIKGSGPACPTKK